MIQGIYPPMIDANCHMPLHAWLIEAGLAGMAMEDLFDGFCKRLTKTGIPIARGFLSIGGLHPLRRAFSLTWQDGGISDAVDFNYATMATPLWYESPFRFMMETQTWRLHRRLTGEGAILDYPVLREFRDAGLTEWLAFMLGFGWESARGEESHLGVVLSWATKGDGGWSLSERATIEALSGTLALAAKGSNASRFTRDLLAAYLGGHAADRVITGQVQRGAVSRIAAAILYSDLRDFTDFAEVTSPEEVTRRLNGIFDCLGEPVRAAGGEILKFLGDGVLAVFLPTASVDAAARAAAALAAAHEILARVEAQNAAEVAVGHPPLRLNMALHAGEVIYGNIGTVDRLDFTVIGHAVNEAARLEKLCKQLGVSMLISESFLQAAPGLQAQLRSMGRHRLKGVRQARQVFTVESSHGSRRRAE
jgi:adenylate cyclase